MEARYVALLILVPFAAIFAYCTWQEYRRFKTEGRSIYGLSYDPETNTTHVGPIPEDEQSFDPDLLETEAKARQEGEVEDDASEDKRHARDTDQPDTDDKPQDTRT